MVDSAGTLLAFSDRLMPAQPPTQVGTRTLTGAAPGPGNTTWVADAAGAILRLDPAGVPDREIEAPFPAPALSADAAGGLWVARSPAGIRFEIGTAEAPLLIRLNSEGAAESAVGQASVPDHLLLQDLANAGYLTAAGDRIFFAPFIRDQLVALTPAGDTLWVASRGLPQTTTEPRFELDEGRPVIDYHPVNLGLVAGLDGNLYLLSTPGFTMTASRLDVFDPTTGALLRTLALDTPSPTLAADAEGRVSLLDPDVLLTGSAPRERPAGPRFDLPLLRGTGRVTSEGLRGRVVLINLWASWCGPCREEMPALDSLRRRITDSGFVFLALNEDRNPEDARKFLDGYGFDFPVPLGGGEQDSRFHYPGLPFTVLLDRQGRVVRTWIGYAGPHQTGLIETVIRTELARDHGRPAVDHTQHRR